MQHPSLEVQGDKVAIRPGQKGMIVDREATFRQTLTRLKTGDRTIALTMQEGRPWLGTDPLGTMAPGLHGRPRPQALTA